MGSISWIGFKDASRAECLDMLGMSPALRNERDPRFFLAELPTGWTILFSQDYAFASEKRLRSLSNGGAVLGLQASETVMCATTTLFDHGRQVWRVDYDCEFGHPEVAGTPPAEYQAIYERLIAEQDASDITDSEIDFIFETPIELALAVTGFRHDRSEFHWGVPIFHALQASDAPRPGGLFAHLLGRRV